MGGKLNLTNEEVQQSYANFREQALSFISDKPDVDGLTEFVGIDTAEFFIRMYTARQHNGDRGAAAVIDAEINIAFNRKLWAETDPDRKFVYQ